MVACRSLDKAGWEKWRSSLKGKDSRMCSKYISNFFEVVKLVWGFRLLPYPGV